jgi:hypothetical protein
MNSVRHPIKARRETNFSAFNEGLKQEGVDMKPLVKTFLTTMTAVSFAAVTTSATLAQRANPMDGVAEQLGLEPAQFQSCLGEPPARGTRPSEADHTALIECLIGQNGSLTADQINAAMGAMRDAPPPRQK